MKSLPALKIILQFDREELATSTGACAETEPFASMTFNEPVSERKESIYREPAGSNF